MNSIVSTFFVASSFLSCACHEDPPGAVPDGDAKSAERATPASVSAPASVLPALVAKEKLEARFPASVGDWSRIELHCITQKIRDGDIVDDIAQADGVYQIGNQPTLVFVSLLDTRGFRSTHGSFRAMRDQPNTGITPFEHQGYPAVEAFSARPLQTILQVLIDDRFLVLITGEGSDQATVRRFLEALDLRAIAELE